MSSAAASPAEKGRHAAEASSGAVASSTGKCHSVRGRREIPTQPAAAQCHCIQQLVLTPGAACCGDLGTGCWAEAFKTCNEDMKNR